jgi:hypothetical protein
MLKDTCPFLCDVMDRIDEDTKMDATCINGY